MNRLASAPWPLKALLIGLAGAVLAGAICALAAVIALIGLRRFSFDLDPAQVPIWFWYFREDPLVRRWLGVGLGVSIAAAGLVAIRMASPPRPPLHGAAVWASEAQVRRAGLRAPQGVVLGRKGGRLLVFGGQEHVLIHAPTRSGKGVGVVIPNLLTWPDSLVVVDLKGENWDASAGYRAALGHQVIRFDPLDPQGRTARFNPMGHIDRRDPAQVLDELQKLAAMLFSTPAHAEAFWSDAARTAFIGVGALVAETAALPFSLGAIYRELTKENPRVRLAEIVRTRAEAGDPVSAGCASAILDFCSASENTFAGIRQTVTARMNLWLNPRVRAATDVSDFDLRNLREQRMAIYLCASPDDLSRLAPLYSLLLQQLVDHSVKERPRADGQARQVLVVLDEFARLGHAGAIARGFSFVGGYGLRFLAVLQSPAQLRAEYGPDLAQEIIDNCGVEIAFAPKDLKVASDISERLGYWTYVGRSTSRPSGLSSGRRNITESDQRRALLMPQELMQLDPARIIVLRAGVPPIRGRKVIYWREEIFRRRVLPPPAVRSMPAASSLYGEDSSRGSAEAASPAYGEAFVESYVAAPGKGARAATTQDLRFDRPRAWSDRPERNPGHNR